MALFPQERSEELCLKVLYTFDRKDDQVCLAKTQFLFPISFVGQNPEKDWVGTTLLNYCLFLIAKSSAETTVPGASDYSIYSVDCTEPGEPMTGHGLMSKILSEYQSKTCRRRNNSSDIKISGKLRALGKIKWFEVRLRLYTVANKRQKDYAGQMKDFYTNIEKSLHLSESCVELRPKCSNVAANKKLSRGKSINDSLNSQVFAPEMPSSPPPLPLENADSLEEEYPEADKYQQQLFSDTSVCESPNDSCKGSLVLPEKPHSDIMGQRGKIDVIKKNFRIIESQKRHKRKKSEEKKQPKPHEKIYKVLKKGQVEYCENCGSIETSTWRRYRITVTETNEDKNMILCNACGLYFNRNGKLRESDLWSSYSSKDLLLLETEKQTANDDPPTIKPDSTAKKPDPTPKLEPKKRGRKKKVDNKNSANLTNDDEKRDADEDFTNVFSDEIVELLSTMDNSKYLNEDELFAHSSTSLFEEFFSAHDNNMGCIDETAKASNQIQNENILVSLFSEANYDRTPSKSSTSASQSDFSFQKSSPLKENIDPSTGNSPFFIKDKAS